MSLSSPDSARAVLFVRRELFLLIYTLLTEPAQKLVMGP